MALKAARQESVAQLDRIRSPEAGAAIAGALVLGGAEEAQIQLDVVRTMGADAPRSAQPVPAWLSAKAHESLSATLDAERLHKEALAVDPRWEPALYSLAGYALDRGDCPRALDLLHRAKAPYDDPLRLEAEEFTPPAREDLGETSHVGAGRAASTRCATWVRKWRRWSTARGGCTRNRCGLPQLTLCVTYG